MKKRRDEKRLHMAFYTVKGILNLCLLVSCERQYVSRNPLHLSYVPIDIQVHHTRILVTVVEMILLFIIPILSFP